MILGYVAIIRKVTKRHRAVTHKLTEVTMYDTLNVTISYHECYQELPYGTQYRNMLFYQ